MSNFNVETNKDIRTFTENQFVEWNRIWILCWKRNSDTEVSRFLVRRVQYSRYDSVDIFERFQDAMHANNEHICVSDNLSYSKEAPFGALLLSFCRAF